MLPRVAFFPDSFHEINGVAHTSRNFEAFHRRRGIPFFIVHPTNSPDAPPKQEGSVTSIEVHRGWASVPLDRGLKFDPLFWRHAARVEAALAQYKPDLIHITGPNDFGIMGWILARKLKLPLAASWHTNVHEYAGDRFSKWLPLSRSARASAASKIEQWTFAASAWFYREARVLYAPNKELIELLERATGRPCFLMQRGVDTELFSPHFRDRTDDAFTIGFVGRLSVEKNVRFLADIERGLLARGLSRFKFLIVGQGDEEEWLRANLRHAEFAGVLRGKDLSRAYANMDLFAFPSFTDTFGNVVLEALASGTPAVVTSGGGPKFIVRHGETGFVAQSAEEFVTHTARLVEDRTLHAQMRAAALSYARDCSWDRVFEAVYAGYGHALSEAHTGAAAR